MARSAQESIIFKSSSHHFCVLPKVKQPMAENVAVNAVEANDIHFKYTVDASAMRALTDVEINAAPEVLAGVSFCVPQGSRVVLLGHNGAGKA